MERRPLRPKRFPRAEDRGRHHKPRGQLLRCENCWYRDSSNQANEFEKCRWPQGWMSREFLCISRWNGLRMKDFWKYIRGAALSCSIFAGRHLRRNRTARPSRRRRGAPRDRTAKRCQGTSRTRRDRRRNRCTGSPHAADQRRIPAIHRSECEVPCGSDRTLGSRMLQRAIERACTLPFASPSAFLKRQSVSPDLRELFLISADQHCRILEAIAGREGMRAEMITREHALVARRNLEDALKHRDIPEDIAGAKLTLVTVARHCA